jgi:excisionase family DNA binding protein
MSAENETDDVPRFVTEDTARRRAEVSASTLRRWIADGALKAYRPNGFRRRLIDLHELDALVLAGLEPVAEGK